MTISTNPARNEYTSTAGQTVFNYTFKIYTNADLNVYVTPAGQDANDATDITTAYTVDPGTIGDDAGGFITLDSPLSVGDKVTIVSDIPTDRTTDYQVNGDFIPDTVNNDIDRTVSLVKQVENLASRTVKFQESQQSASNITLPAPSPGKGIKWNAGGDGFENTVYDPDSAAQEAAASAATSASNAATSESNAATSASNAATSEINAAASAASASVSETNAAQSANDAAAIASSYATLASPSFTGTPTAPTASQGTNTTQLATTAFVQSALNPDTQINAWVSFRGNSTVLIRDSFNVSSMTDRGTGAYTANFTTAMATANYVFSGSGAFISASTAVLVGQNNADTKNTGSLQFHTSNSASGARLDYSNVNLIVAGGS